MHWFSHPVTIKVANGMQEVRDVERSIEVMRGWPVKRKLRAAYPICYGACADPPTSTIAEAREAFVAAAREARLLR